MHARLVYKANPKHKRGAMGEGPPRWFPDSASLCPDDITQKLAQTLLEQSIAAADSSHPGGRARFALHQGSFFKAYPTEQRPDVEVWHGYPVPRELVNRQVPARILREFVEWTADELKKAGETADCAELDAWLKRLDTPEQARAALLGYAGLDSTRWDAIRSGDAAVTPEDFFGLDTSWATLGAAADPTESAIAVAFRCCSPHLTQDDLMTIRELVQNTPARPDAMRKLDDMRRTIPELGDSTRDYDQGYELAIAVRRLLGNELERFDIEALLGDLLIPVHDIELDDPDLDGCSICDTQHGPVIFVNRGSVKAMAPWGRRMILAHELCHLLFDREQAVPLAIVSGPWAPAIVERRANAFAAELLLPEAAIKQALGNHPWLDNKLETLMDTYEVGITMCTWHMRNRGWDGDD